MSYYSSLIIRYHLHRSFIHVLRVVIIVYISNHLSGSSYYTTTCMCFNILVPVVVPFVSHTCTSSHSNQQQSRRQQQIFNHNYRKNIKAFHKYTFHCTNSKNTDFHIQHNGDDDGESFVERQLRDFFSDIHGDLFTVADNVMDSFLTQRRVIHSKSESNGTMSILKRCGDHDNYLSTKEKIEESNTATSLFNPLFSNNNNYQSCRTSLHNNHDNDTTTTSKINQQNKKGQSFKIIVAYKGNKFCGWQIQPNNIIPSVQQTLIDILNPIMMKKHSEVSKPIDIRVCGRTDAGVSAIAQVCRVRTNLNPDEVTPMDIQNRINDLGKGNLWCTSVARVSEKFHPTFGANLRAYVYLINSSRLNEFINSTTNSTKNITIERVVSILNQMTSRVEGLELDYIGLSYGKVKTSTTLCTLYRARVTTVTINNNERSGDDSLTTNEAICFEFVGNRFLRRMIRIMVSTLLSLVLQHIRDNDDSNCGENVEDLFLELIQRNDRQLSSKPAAPSGLIFVGGSFVENESNILYT